MSETTSRGHQETYQREDREDTAAATRAQSARRRWGAATVVVLVVLGAGAGAAWSAGAFRSNRSFGGNAGARPPQTYTVTRKDISATTSENATLGYAASYTVTGQGGGTLTWLPSAGQVIRRGQGRDRTENGTPGGGLDGRGPGCRAVSGGSTGTRGRRASQCRGDVAY